MLPAGILCTSRLWQCVTLSLTKQNSKFLADLDLEDLEDSGEFRWHESEHTRRAIAAGFGALYTRRFEDNVTTEATRHWEPPFPIDDDCSDNEDLPSDDEDQPLPPATPVTAVQSVSQIKKQPADLAFPDEFQPRVPVALPEDSRFASRPVCSQCFQHFIDYC